jgi:hypothetical protein
MLFDRLALADPAQGTVNLGQPFWRNDEIDALAHRFCRGKSEHAFGRRIPACYLAFQGFRDDGIVGRFDRGAEKTLTLGEVASGGFGGAMFRDFALELDGFRIGFADHPGECTCQHAGLAARIDRNGGRTVAAGALDGRG